MPLSIPFYLLSYIHSAIDLTYTTDEGEEHGLESGSGDHENDIEATPFINLITTDEEGSGCKRKAEGWAGDERPLKKVKTDGLRV